MHLDSARQVDRQVFRVLVSSRSVNLLWAWIADKKNKTADEAGIKEASAHAPHRRVPVTLIEGLELKIRQLEEASDAKKKVLDEIASILHPHWKRAHNAYVPSQLANKLQEELLKRVPRYTEDQARELAHKLARSALEAYGITWDDAGNMRHKQSGSRESVLGRLIEEGLVTK